MRTCAAILLLGTLSCATAQAQGAHALYKWVDEQGIVHYTDHLPPNAVQRERDVLDAHGDVRKVLPAEKSAAEIERESERQQKAREAADYDRSLLLTYSSVHDIERARDDRLSTYDLRLQQAQKQVDDTQATLSDLRARADAAKADGNPPDPDLEAQVTTFEKALADNYDALAKLRADRQGAVDKFAHDIERFKQLKSQGGTGRGGATKPNG
jgi:hypothetical protein